MKNEKRLIDVNAEIRKMKDVLSKMKTDQRSLAVEIIIAGLERATTVDAVEVVHGRWVLYFDGKELQCSVCKATFWDEEQNGGTNYCPNCGAKMDG